MKPASGRDSTKSRSNGARRDVSNLRCRLTSAASGSPNGIARSTALARGTCRPINLAALPDSDMQSIIPPDRASLLRELDQTALWDVVVIGGGATGLGTAVDAASRGYRTLLLEARDFAKGTSSKATKLVHGGVRYLAQGNIALVREALRERGLLARNAPHVVSALGFVVPAYSRRDKPFHGAGLKIYDWLAGSLNLAASRSLSLAETRAEMPTLAESLHGRPLRGGTIYYDGQFDDARLAITLMRTVFDLGGVALNNAAVRGVTFDAAAREHRIAVEEVETGDRLTVRARCVVNATGVWVDAIRAMADPSARPIVAPSQGVHLTLPGHFLRAAMRSWCRRQMTAGSCSSCHGMDRRSSGPPIHRAATCRSNRARAMRKSTSSSRPPRTICRSRRRETTC